MSQLDKVFADLPDFLTVRELAEITGKDRTTMYRWLRKGEIPASRKQDSTWLISRDQVREYMERKYGATDAASPDLRTGNS
jgi:excisionase family DNA binding protein